ncbi:hypothetical protein D3C73_184860 [compost metagenome]
MCVIYYLKEVIVICITESLNKVGISNTYDDGTEKSFTVIVDEIIARWDDLGQNERSDLISNLVQNEGR